ncbi:Na+/H+ antiporter NhaC family protein [Algicola sagamiensis]|uniref:Na+/H+ antiporter NhaC family protein n=1 Tax=Algicola sagamiensis TaxID=163869 RepID=UPI00037D199C|nr:Na+/H+ antiporter NhaC family protein [Algicola sagamiensis]
MKDIRSILSLSPLLLFLAIFVGNGLYHQAQGTEYAFYQLSAPVAIIPAIILAVLISRLRVNESIEKFISGCGHSNIMAMCLIFLLAGAFTAVNKATGGTEATIALGLQVIPESFLLPGIFIVAAFIATAMGTSMGTIAAVAPIALGVATSASLDPLWVAGAVLGGAIFGDNLSIISDTTIAATRSQGSEMKDKFKENAWIAIPAALVCIPIFYVLSGTTEVTAPSVENPWLALPYLLILIFAVAGVNVFIVLTLGILLSGGMAIAGGEYGFIQFGKDIYAGFTNMQEIFILSILIGGLGEIIRANGGFNAIRQFIEWFIQKANGKKSVAELGLGTFAALTNVCTANNTVAIVICGDVARDVAQKNDITPKRSASLLDIFACVIQGLLPYAAQVLLLGSLFKLNPIEIVTHNIYGVALAASAIITIFLRKRTA